MVTSDAREVVDVLIVGAGAAGLTAGIFALQARPGAKVLLLDGARKVGAKILVAGGGRCNVTHFQTTPKDYNAASSGFVKNVLKSFTADDTKRWMQSLGVELKREPTGKLFPITDQARTVLDALLNRLAELGGELRTDCRVRAVRKDGEIFVVDSYGGTFRARKLILCTGGRSLPKTGSDGGGYELVKSLGHTVDDQHPALVSMTLQQHFCHADLAGISHHVEITTSAGDRPIDRRSGNLLWTHFGVTGPVVMDASRHWLSSKLAGGKPTWTVNLLPGTTPEQLEAWLLAAVANRPTVSLRRLLQELEPAGAIEPLPLPAKVIDAALGLGEVDGGTKLSQVSKEARKRTIRMLLAMPLPVEQDRGWNHAEVTAGGVPLSEVAWRGMISRACEGLHLAGEIVDVDGRIGGFNFQWAWATGKLAGEAAAAALAVD